MWLRVSMVLLGNPVGGSSNNQGDLASTNSAFHSQRQHTKRGLRLHQGNYLAVMNAMSKPKLD